MATEDENICFTVIDQKKYILGRRQNSSNGYLNIGRFYALDGSSGASVKMDALFPHAVLICGKRGYGKSYTLGVLVEEIASLDEEIRKNLAVVIIDTLGIFWTMAYPNLIQQEEQQKWGIHSRSFDIDLFIPENAITEYTHLPLNTMPFHLSASDLTPEHWCQLFNIQSTDPFGMILIHAILKLKDTHTSFTIQDIIQVIRDSTFCDDTTKKVAENHLQMAVSWNIFKSEGTMLDALLKPGNITVLDISHIPEMMVKQVLVNLISDQMFQYRVQARKKQEQRNMGLITTEQHTPLIWLAIDEAQLFLPANQNMLTKQILIEKWLRQGRQPGLSLIMATQRPSSIDEEVLSHCDLIFCHRLTAQDDIMSLQKLRPTYMKGSIEDIMKKIGKEKGVCLVIDDTMEEAHIVKIRPRMSWHGGGEPCASEITEQNVYSQPETS